MLRLLRYLKPYNLSIAAILVLVFLQSMSQLFLPTLMSDMVDIGIANGDNGYILRIGALMLLVAALGTTCSVLSSLLSAKTSSSFGKDIRTRLFSKAESFSLNEFDQVGTSSLITRTTNDITQMQQVVGLLLRMLVSAPLMIVGGLIMAVSKDLQLALVMFVSVPVLFTSVTIIARVSVPLFKALQQKLDGLNRVLRESLTGVRVIRAFNRIEHEKRRFNDTNLDLTSTAVKVNKIMALTMPMMQLIMNWTVVAIVWYGSIRINAGSMQVGDLMAFIQYVTQIMFSLLALSMIFVMLPRASVSADRINEVLDMEATIKDAPEVKSADSQHGYVEFQDVTFSYPGAEKPALSNITFSAGPGEVTAIIGGTGCGKSTLINLIPRFYDIDSGKILVDGVDITEMSQKSLRAKIGLVPQRALLFTGSIADNVRFGKEDATDSEVEEAVETAQASDFIHHMEKGFNSVVAQGGTNLSGGQKQRLAIARALVRKPEIYIFDDSFSALDFKTDAKLRAALKEVTAHSTVLVVAQRVSTVMGADRIIVLDDGKIASIGTHQQLLQTCEVYREIASSQLSEEELAS